MNRAKRTKELTKAARLAAPGAPLADFEKILEIAGAGHLRHLPASIAISQAISSHIRHQYTEYDELLNDGYDRDSARHFVVDEMNEVLERWRATFKIDPLASD